MRGLRRRGFRLRPYTRREQQTKTHSATLVHLRPRMYMEVLSDRGGIVDYPRGFGLASTLYYPHIAVFLAQCYLTIVLWTPDWRREDGCVQAELVDGEEDLDIWVASWGAGTAFSSWSEAHMPAAAKAVIAREIRKRVFAGNTAHDSHIDLSRTGFVRNLNSGCFCLDSEDGCGV